MLAACGSLTKFTTAIDSDPEGARIEVNGNYIGVTPTTYTVQGNDDRSFNGGWIQGPSITYTAFPPNGQPNLYLQSKSFSPSAFFKQGDHIPERIFFDMHLKTDANGYAPIHIDVDSK